MVLPSQSSRLAPATRPCSRGRSIPRSALILESVIALPFPLGFPYVGLCSHPFFVSFVCLSFYPLLFIFCLLSFLFLSVGLCCHPFLIPFPWCILITSSTTARLTTVLSSFLPFPSLPFLFLCTRVERSLHWSPTPHTPTATGSAWLPSPATIPLQWSPDLET